MSARTAQVGALVTTVYTGRVTTHRIIARSDDRSHGHSQSGVLFQLDPPVPKSGGPAAWIDADWFEPATCRRCGRALVAGSVHTCTPQRRLF